MQFNWQDLLVAVPVLAATSYLIRRAWLLLRGRSRVGCGSACGGCTTEKSEPANVVQLELPRGGDQRRQ